MLTMTKQKKIRMTKHGKTLDTLFRGLMYWQKLLKFEFSLGGAGLEISTQYLWVGFLVYKYNLIQQALM
jgi:hypothetical protein